MGPLLDKLLATCANVDDVKELFNTYNVPSQDRARIPVMDKSGVSMIVEWYDGEVVFLETDKPFQVATNFTGSKYFGQGKPCWRYNNAIEVVEKSDTFSLTTMIDALDATDVASPASTTVYSFICDLKKGDIYVYNYHDYSESLKFNIHEAETTGRWEYYLRELFPDHSAEYEPFIEEGPARMIKVGYNSNIQVCLMFFNLLRTEYPIAFNREIGINTLSQIGTTLVERGKLEDGITFLERNMKEFPDSARSHFELAEVYLNNGYQEKAITEYKKALAIDPNHMKAKKVVESLLLNNTLR